MKNRLLILDSARAIAALAVVIYHFTYRYAELYYPERLLAFGMFHKLKYGVEFFFIVSGFVILWSVDNARTKSQFIKSRFIRLYPIYIVMLTFSFILISILGLEGRGVSFNEYILNFLMFHDYLGIKHVDGVYWSLAVELNFYFFVFIFLWINKIEGIKYFLLSTSLLGLLSEYNLLALPDRLLLITISKYSVYFLFGVVSYELKFKKKSKQILVLLLITFIILILLSVLHTTFAPIFITLFFGWLLVYEPKVFVNPILLTLGSASYVLYLVHQNLGYIILNKLISNGVQYYWALLICLILVIALSILFHKKLEIPLTRRVKKYLP